MDYNQIGIGIDIVQIVRFERLVQDIGIPFLKRIFRPSEVATALERPNPIQSLAGVFSLKEAVIKSLPQTQLTLMDLQKIEIKKKRDSSLAVTLPSSFDYQISGSIAHDGNYVIGTAILF